MNTLFDDSARDDILRRLAALPADGQRRWGKMNPAQALAHCALGIEAATGDRPMKQKFIGKLLAPLFRGALVGPKPFAKNAPTAPELIVSDARDFARERDRLVAGIRKFAAAGRTSAAKFEHGFLGQTTGDEWGLLMHKHIDHHLRQFGG